MSNLKHFWLATFSSREAALLLLSTKNRDLWPAPISSPRFLDFRSFYAHLAFNTVVTACLPFWRVASRATARMSLIHVFRDALNYGLEILGLSDIELKEKQYEALKAEQYEALKTVVLKNRDVLAVLPTRYGKSLIYQLLPLVLDFFTANGSPVGKSTVIVISPLNALMRDQIVKLKEGGLDVCVLKGDHVASTDANGDEEFSVYVPVEILVNTTFDLIFAHPEVLIVNKKVLKILKLSQFKEKVKAIVMDEAHLVINWQVFQKNLMKINNLYGCCIVFRGLKKGKNFKNLSQSNPRSN